MKVVVDQPIAASADEAQAAFLDPAFYANLAQLEVISAPEVRSISVGATTAHSVLIYRFTGQLNGVARSILDPAKLTWSQETEVDLASRRTTVRMVPDHYERLLSFGGWYELRNKGDGGCTQHFEADLRVHLPLLGPLAERAIGGNVRDNIAITAKLLERYVAAKRARP